MLVVMLLFSVSAMAAVEVTGTVYDGEDPIPGASVLVQGTTIGTSTGADGSFKISVPSTTSVLEISFLGYTTETVQVGSKTNFQIFLESESIMAEELVVIGYGVQQRSHLTGSVSRIGGEGIVDMPVSDVATALQGKISGLNISSTTSEVGVAPQIRVRGVGSLSADNSPLIVIDGFPSDDEDALSLVNPSDILSIEVLKDAASSAIYGSRGANGVILVTTKGGSADKPNYSIKYYTGMKFAYKLHDMYTSSEYLTKLEEEYELGGSSAGNSYKVAAYLEDQLGSTDWQKLALQEASTINTVQASVSGGKTGMRYYLSGAYTEDEGLMEENEVTKFNFRAKFDADLSKSVTVGINFSGTYSETLRPTNTFINYYRTPSFLPVVHNDFTTELTGGYTGWAHGRHFTTYSVTQSDDGTYSFGSSSTPFGTANNNPVSVRETSEKGSESFQSTGNAYIDIDIVKGLNFRSSNGYSYRFQPSYVYYEAESGGDGEESEAEYASSLSLTLLTENMLSYNWKKNDHSISALLGYTFEKVRYDYVKLEASGFATDDVKTLNAATVFTLSSGTTTNTGTTSNPTRALESYLSRINYAFGDKYLASASIRLDRNSRFQKGNQDGWFPSASLGWRISEEDFLKNVDWIDMLKFRASYGVTGNDRIDTYSAWNILGYNNYVTGEGTGNLVSGVGSVTGDTRSNEDISWEKTDEYNYGVDFTIFNGKVNLVVDAYYSVTRDLLMERSVPSFTGYTLEWENIGRIRNKGLEVTVDVVPIRNKNFTWMVSGNIAFNDAIMLELNGLEQIISYGNLDEQYLAKVGEAPIQFYGYKVIGVWNSQDEIDSNAHFASGVDTAGGLRVEDVNGDGVLDDNDKTVLGDPYADFTWGLTNTFNYKKFDLSILIQGSQGGEVYNSDGRYNETKRWVKAYSETRWISADNPGDGMTPYDNRGMDMTSTDYFIEDASYACLRNVTLGYTFDKSIAQKFGLGGIRIYAAGTNLLYVWSSDYRGINIESRTTSGTYDSALIGGYQGGGYPITSTVTLGIDLKF